MILELLYKTIEEQVKKQISLIKQETNLDEIYAFIKDEVKKTFHLQANSSYAMQFDILPGHATLQSVSMKPFYIIVNADASGSMVNTAGETVYNYNALIGDDAYIAVSFYRNCGLYTTTVIDPNKVPKKVK